MINKRKISLVASFLLATNLYSQQTSLDEITSTTAVDNTQTTGTPVSGSSATAPDTSSSTTSTPSSTTTTTTEVTVQETPTPATPVTPVDKSTGELVGDIFDGIADLMHNDPGGYDYVI